MKTKGIFLIACFSLLLHDANCASLFKYLTGGGKNHKNKQGKSPVDEYIGNYKLLNKTLGDGKYAEVELAQHNQTGQVVAIKITDEAKLELKTLEDGLLINEGKIMRMLNHKYILKLIDKFDDKKKKMQYLVLEYAPGGDLFDYSQTKNKKRLDEIEARRIFRQILSAVEYCHYKKVAHRDLKPENFLLDVNGDIKLTDFGYADEFKENKKLEVFCGSEYYEAPEIVNEIPYDGRKSDVYSLGVTLYMITTGFFPFDDYGAYIVPEEVSPECQQLLTRFLNKNPEQRPFLRDLMLEPNDNWFNIGCEKLLPYNEHAPNTHSNT